MVDKFSSFHFLLMQTVKDFFKSKAGKRSLWTLLNSAMALIVSFVTYQASQNVAVAVSVLPFAQAVSQFFTKYLNSKHNE